jgi:formate C-acetyltransferase
VQQGDNGQSLTLGGVTPNGDSAVNELTRMVLRVSRDLAMIDPKINLRISAQTDLDLLSLATELTRIGLGFPQYSNDDVVIPALVSHGYALEDARDYVTAACWEFIIPGCGMEVVNIGAVSFPAAVDQAIRAGLQAGIDFEGILDQVAENIDVISVNNDILSQLDFIFAKAKIALEYKAMPPSINNEGYINIKNGRHPLINPDVVVPNSIWLGKDLT